MSKKVLVVAVAVALSLMWTLVAFAINGAFRIHNYGTIESTKSLQVAPSEIDWGTGLKPNQIVKRDIQVWNAGTTPTKIGFSIGNFTPTEAETYFTVSWNYTGQMIGQAKVPLLLTLEISPTIQNITDFSFDLTVSPI